MPAATRIFAFHKMCPFIALLIRTAHRSRRISGRIISWWHTWLLTLRMVSLALTRISKSSFCLRPALLDRPWPLELSCNQAKVLLSKKKRRERKKRVFSGPYLNQIFKAALPHTHTRWGSIYQATSLNTKAPRDKSDEGFFFLLLSLSLCLFLCVCICVRNLFNGETPSCRLILRCHETHTPLRGFFLRPAS